MHGKMQCPGAFIRDSKVFQLVFQAKIEGTQIFKFGNQLNQSMRPKSSYMPFQQKKYPFQGSAKICVSGA